jgi:hypothetical protein
MKNKFRKEEWENNLKFYQNLFSTSSFKQFHEMVGDQKGTIDHFEGEKDRLQRGEYNLRKTSQDKRLAHITKVDLKEFSEINTIKRNTMTRIWDKTSDNEEKDELYDSRDFNSGGSETSNMFDTSSSIDDVDNNEIPSSLEASRDNDNIRNLIEKCIMEGNIENPDSMSQSLSDIKESPNESTTYQDPFESKFRNTSDAFQKPTKEDTSYKTSFVKFRDIKYIETYDFDTVEANIVWNPLKESKVMKDSANVPNQAFSLQRTCFDKIENKLIYAMTEAFRSNSKDIVDTELLELIQAIFQNPGDEETVSKFFKKGKYELEHSKKYLFKFHVVCKNFLSLEKEGLLRRQNRFIKSLRDFTIRKFVKDQEITVIKISEDPDANSINNQSGISFAKGSNMTSHSKITSATRIDSNSYTKNYDNDEKPRKLKKSKSKHTFYLVRKDTRNSHMRKKNPKYKMPSIYVKPLILKAFRSAVTDPKSDFQMISALNVNDYYSRKDLNEVPRYSEDDVFSDLKKRKYVIFSVQNLFEMFEMLFDKQKEMFEMKVKTNMIEYFLRKRFEIVKGQMLGTFTELHLTRYFKDIHDLREGNNHK